MVVYNGFDRQLFHAARRLTNRNRGKPIAGTDRRRVIIIFGVPLRLSSKACDARLDPTFSDSRCTLLPDRASASQIESWHRLTDDTLIVNVPGLPSALSPTKKVDPNSTRIRCEKFAYAAGSRPLDYIDLPRTRSYAASEYLNG